MSETPEEAEARRLVDRLADLDPPEPRHEIIDKLGKLGASAIAAVRDGLRHGNWQVRRWCAIYLDQHPDAVSLELVIPLLRDPKKEVRLWAVHTLSCDRCKGGVTPLDVVPLLIERIELDESIRVRRMATAMLAYGKPDVRAVPILEALVEHDPDPKVRNHAVLGIMRCREVGIATSR